MKTIAMIVSAKNRSSLLVSVPVVDEKFGGDKFTLPKQVYLVSISIAQLKQAGVKNFQGLLELLAGNMVNHGVVKVRVLDAPNFYFCFSEGNNDMTKHGKELARVNSLLT